MYELTPAKSERVVAGQGAVTAGYALDSGGVDRGYRVYRPPSAGPGAALVMVLHGGYGSAAQAERTYGWNEQADRDGFVVVYPDGLRRAWNTEGGDCCGPAERRDIDDVAFVTTLLDRVNQNYGTDPDAPTRPV